MDIMTDRPFGARLKSLVRHHWQTGLLIAGAFIIVGDVALHLWLPNGDQGPANRPVAPAAPVVSEAAATQAPVKLTMDQRAAAGVMVERVALKPHAEVFRAPGEVHVNDYATSNAGARLRATVLSRSARLGDRVRKDQVLATLYSAEMAEAETAFVLASKNYTRMNALKDYVSGQQYDEADVKRLEARGRLSTYGLSTAEISQLESGGLGDRPAGQFDLRAPQDGVITTDAFRPGEVVEPGKTLFEVSDLATVWVEAQVSPAIAPRIAGTRARVTLGDRSFDGKILQTLETLDTATRTARVRVQVESRAGELKPGSFVNVELYSASVAEIFVPTVALLRDADGSWLVYEEPSDGEFSPAKVEVLHAAGDETAITGIAEGTKIVTAGAFFVKSEADKASFGED
jgi:RND family efflux transporter MFP subunit